jgi:hypothetical protein
MGDVPSRTSRYKLCGGNVGQATTGSSRSRWNKFRTGSKNSACPSTRSGFADNHIDESILRELTDQDLKDLGVVSLGHRRKMLRVAELAGSTPGSPQPAATSELSDLRALYLLRSF